MIKGMTGFGNAVLSAGKIKGVVEIKSQNHRYFDIVYYLPLGFGSLENKIRQLINAEVSRGRVTVAIKITEKPVEHLNFNREAVKEYLKYARVLTKEFNLENNLKLADLIKLPGVVEAEEPVLDAEALWPAIEKSLKTSLRGLMAMRRSEGRSLAADVNGVLKRMSAQIKKIEARAEMLLRQKKKILSDEEMVSFQKSIDINEEITRLKHYIDEFKTLARTKAGVGKKMDFVAQEMQRETNTIGAKLQDNVVSNAVIALKSKVEKLREQAQNIE